jgi:hypothetical protein
MNNSLTQFVPQIRIRRGLAFGVLILVALLAFEMFNYSTTEFALGDLLGGLQFLSVKWSTILAIAFCGIDFAGIARLFTPEQGADEPAEVWYLFGAWLLAATMNAMLTWWGVSIAIINHASLGNGVVSQEVLLKGVPVFVAVMVWLIRILIIGTFSVAGDRLFSQSDRRVRTNSRPSSTIRPPLPSAVRTMTQASSAPQTFRPAAKPTMNNELNYSRPEPTYHPIGMSSVNQNSRNNSLNH